MAISFAVTESPLGRLLLAGTGKTLLGCWFVGAAHFPPIPEERIRRAPFLAMPGVRHGDCGCKAGLAEDLRKARKTPTPPPPPVVLMSAVMQLGAYFAGERHDFDLPLELVGTPFQIAAWEHLRGIPYGACTTYGEIARNLGKATAVRAVGTALGRNPLSIIVPCHRVLGKDHSLTGYAGGLERKSALLELEGASFKKVR